MASTYTTSLKIQEINSGEQSGTWGNSTNTNWQLIEQAVAGVQTIVMSNANYTMSNLNGVSDEARNMVIVATGTNSAIYQIIAPLVPKIYVVSNQTSGGYSITFGAATGSTVTIPNGVNTIVYCDGSTGFFTGINSIIGNQTITGNLTVTGNATVNNALTANTGFASYPAASFTGGISGTTLTVSAVSSGYVFVGQHISGTGITSGTQVTALGTGTGGTGTYTVSVSQSVSGGTTITGVAGVLALTPPTADNSLNVATTAYVQSALSAATVNTAINAQNIVGATQTAVFSAGITTTNMTVASVTSGTIYIGQTISGTGVTSGTKIVSQTSGTTGGAGVYVVSISQSVSTGTTITSTGSWSVTPTGSKLYFAFNSVNLASLDSNGNLITLGTVTGGGTP